MARDVAVVTRSINEHLYAKAQAFFDPEWKRYRVVESDAYGYLVYATSLPHAWVINVDEDCFLYDYRRVNAMIDYMETAGYHYSGQADGGVTVMREHNPLAMNPYFNVFNAAAISANKSEKARAFEGLEHLVDPCAMKFNYPHHSPDYQLEGRGWKLNNFEPYYPFFFWLLEHFKPLWLGGREYPFWHMPPLNETQPATIICDHENEPLAIHSWYAREYHCNPWYRFRLDQCVAEALRQRDYYERCYAKQREVKAGVES